MGVQTPVTAPAPPAPTVPGAQLAGIDVSSFQGDINWTQVKASGISFAFIKATEGLSVIDQGFAQNWAQAQAAGVIVGPYHYFHPGDDPVQAANIFLKTVGTMTNMNLPCALDYEVLDGVEVSLANANALTWMQTVQAATGKAPFFYSDLGFIEGLTLPQGFTNYPLWQAEWNSVITAIAPPWSYVSIWQNSSKGNIPGISGNVDTDIFYGTMSQLMNFCLAS